MGAPRRTADGVSDIRFRLASAAFPPRHAGTMCELERERERDESAMCESGFEAYLSSVLVSTVKGIESSVENGVGISRVASAGDVCSSVAGSSGYWCQGMQGLVEVSGGCTCVAHFFGNVVL